MPLTSPSALRGALGAAAVVVCLLVVGAVPAAAHVTVSSPDAKTGGFGKLAFRVPTESDTASTTKVEVALPTDTPFAFVSTKPHSGWTVATTERALDKPLEAEGFTLTKAVSTVTWTADKGQGIKPGQFDEFELSVGPFPKRAGTLTMPAVQTYDDGSVIRWDQKAAAGQAEPEHPAPQLALVATGANAQAPTAAAAASPANTPADTPADTVANSTSSDNTARWLAVAGVVLAAAALLVALTGARRRSA